MSVDNLAGWSTLLLFCSFALFIEATGFARALLGTQRTFWRCFLLVIPLAVSICSITLAVQTLTLPPPLPLPDLHFTASMLQHDLSLSRRALELCQIQIGISIAVFVLLLLLERMLGIKYVSFLLHQREGDVRF